MADIMTPALGESVTEATVARWTKKAGDAVRKDEILVELETDKVSLEVAAPSDGTLSEINAEEGATVEPGAVLGKITEGAAQPAAPKKANGAGGGGKPADPSLAAGLFVAPTVFDKVTPSMRIGREEIFGPVMSLMTWDDFEDMLTKVNGVEYGLTAAIVTNDLAKAMETAERIEAGYVWINSTGRYIGAPYGGWKQSGIGEEECFDEILSYTQVKNINMRW